MTRPPPSSPKRKKLAEKFRQKTADASRLRYGTMRKVPFSDWEDVGRFAQYARAHLAVAESAYQRLDYWENLYDLFTHGQLTQPLAKTLTKKQEREFAELQKEISQLPPAERTSLAKQVESRHRETLDLLGRMAREGLLRPDDYTPAKNFRAKSPSSSSPKIQWAVGRDSKGLPLIEGGQLQLYQTQAPPFGQNLLDALSGASKFRTACGAPGKLGFFLGYTGRSTVKYLFQRPFANSLTAKEKHQIQATNEMIRFLYQEWSKPSHPTMKTPSSKNHISETIVTAPSTPAVLPPEPTPALSSSEAAPSHQSIVNHITIHGSMNGNIGFQRNDASPSRAFPASIPPSAPRQAAKNKSLSAPDLPD